MSSNVHRAPRHLGIMQGRPASENHTTTVLVCVTGRERNLVSRSTGTSLDYLATITSIAQIQLLPTHSLEPRASDQNQIR
jgi:hypothetical protein